MITLAHQWLVTYRGGEKVLGEFRRLFPTAPLASLVCRRGEIPDWIIGTEVITSPLQRIPAAAKYYKALFPLHTWAFGRLAAPPGTKLVLSCDAAMVKGMRVPDGAAHVCYCNSPPRYIWDLQSDYAEHSSGLGAAGRWLFKMAANRAKSFDYASAQNVDHFIGNSKFIADRITRCYNREADHIYPPVSVDDFAWDQPSEKFYLLVTQLTPYKRADIAVDAFTRMRKPLVVIGEGTEFERLKARAGPTVSMLGRQPFTVVKHYFERSRAFLYPQVEDFGITAVEAQAAGKPVLALRKGGATETVTEGETGLFFDEQSSDSLIDCVERFERLEREFSPSLCRQNSERFRPERFRAEVRSFLIKHYPEIFLDYRWPN